MKIQARDILKHLGGKLKPIYLVSGDDGFLVGQIVKDIEQKCLKQSYEIEREVVNTHFNTDQFFELTHEYSLFSTNRCIIFTCEKSNANFTKCLETYAADPNPDLVIIVSTAKLSASDLNKKWYKAFDKVGLHVPIWPIAHAELPRFLVNHARRFNLVLEPEAASLLANLSEGNLFSADQTLEKLSYLHPNERITKAHLHASAEDTAHFDVFDLISAILRGDSQRAFRILQTLVDSEFEPNILLWAIVKELRLLATLHEQSKTSPLPTLFKKHHIWEKRGIEIKSALNRVSYQKCLSLIQLAASIDRILKGYERGNITEKLFNLVAAMGLSDQHQTV